MNATEGKTKQHADAIETLIADYRTAYAKAEVVWREMLFDAIDREVFHRVAAACLLPDIEARVMYRRLWSDLASEFARTNGGQPVDHADAAERLMAERGIRLVR